MKPPQAKNRISCDKKSGKSEKKTREKIRPRKIRHGVARTNERMNPFLSTQTTHTDRRMNHKKIFVTHVVFSRPITHLPIATDCTLKDTNWVYLLFRARAAEMGRTTDELLQLNGYCISPNFSVIPRGRNNFSKKSFSLEYWERIRKQTAL